MSLSPEPERDGFVVQSWHYVTSGLALILAWLARDTLGRIKALERGRIGKADLEKLAETTTREIAKLRHDIRDDLNPLSGRISLLEHNWREDVNKLFEGQRVTAEDVAFIKGRMK